MTSDFDLNSLIEGVVDDDDDDDEEEAAESARSEDAKTPVVLYREALKVRIRQRGCANLAGRHL